MSKKSIILINLIGAIGVVILFLYMIKDEFNIKIDSKKEHNSTKIEQKIDEINRQRDSIISIIKHHDRNKTTPKKASSPNHNQYHTYPHKDYKSYLIDRYQSSPTSKTTSTSSSKSVSKRSKIEPIQSSKKDNNSTQQPKETNQTKSKQSNNNNTSSSSYPNEWGVVWPTSQNTSSNEINSSNLIEDRTIEDIIESVGGDLGDLVLIRIFKSEKKLELWMSITGKYKLLKSYTLASYSGELGPKLSKDDHQAPEGYYNITDNGLILDSFGHYKAEILFPNRFDQEHNITSGYVSIHDEAIDSDGFALKERDMQELYEVLDSTFANGYKNIPVYIYPFVMTQENMDRAKSSKWFNFWENIKEGYDYFMQSYRTPAIKVINGRYIFHVL